MNLRLIGLGSDDEKHLEKIGVSRRAVRRIFFGDSPRGVKVSLARGTPQYMVDFVSREYGASEFAFRSFRNREVTVPDLWTEDYVSSRNGFTCDRKGDLPFDLLPLFYRLSSPAGGCFWLVSYWPYGRITHIFVPSENVVVYEHDSYSAPALAAAIERKGATLLESTAPSGAIRTVAILDLLNNFGHQLMNYLSGIERLLEEVEFHRIDEFWVSGIEFFAPIEKMFPEIAPKLRRFARPWDMYSVLDQGLHLPLRPGTNIYRDSVGRRIRHMARRYKPVIGFNVRRRYPLIAVTVRSAGRICCNLPEALGGAFKELFGKYPNIGVILDGWNIPDGISMLNRYRYYHANTAAHLRMARKIRKHLPSGVVVANAIGSRMSRSVWLTSGIDAYVSHVGTLQHKLAFLTGKPGVVHGPASQLASPDSGHFQADVGYAPLFLTPASVKDIPTSSSRGEGFNDYEIIDVRDLIAKVEQAINMS